MPNLSDLRESYERGALDAADLPADPFALFAAWFADAQAADTREPNAMTLATATADGTPSARIVLLKGVDHGFCFYTNHESRKGRELDANPCAALVWWWPEVERQVRVEGRVERVEAETADAYFASRPRGSRLGAWASPQSRPIPDRRTLEVLLEEIEAETADDDVPRPGFWGGYRVVPEAVEFWQGRASRLHDRHVYRRDDDGWTTERLAP
ncbi:pyridoxamine 5'-phosphate oxidase [Rubrivirga sp. IMCC45206]|uniref:pyridoxamine 5'-phosphate oxidase n=1 Tax=Rubrivirga sp. IMCC45206 TaxID=3391614 RepID=UPI00398FAE48